MRHKKIILLVVLLAALSHVLYAQVITLLTPNSSTPGRLQDVVIRGLNTHFQNGISIADFGQGIVVKKFNVSNPLTGTATIQVDNNAVVGFRTVRVQTGKETAIIENEFEVFTGSGTLHASIELMPIETISLADLDLTVPQRSPILYFVNIYNDNVQRHVKIYVSLSSQSRGFIGTLSTPVITLSPTVFIRYSNRDFTGLDLNGIIGEQFLAIVKKLGTFPPDDYTYRLEVKDEAGNIIATDEDVNVVTNVNVNPELILPGNTFDRPAETIYTPFPLFQWFGQMNRYDFTLYEARSGQTPEEVVRNIAVYQQQDITGTNLVYPNYAEKLVSGKAYAWQVRGKVISSKGTQYLPSEVFWFIYLSMGGNSTRIVSKIEVEPEIVTITTGQKVQLAATCYDENGAIIPNVQPMWSVTPNKGTVTAGGVYTSGAVPGTVAVVAKAGSNNASGFAVVKTGLPEQLSGQWLIRSMIKQLLGLPGN